MSARRPRLLALIGPGLLVAATGVGAGDLAAASLTGSRLGLAIVWAVVLGAFLKFVLNEGLARWQLATGTTPLEGCVKHFGKPVEWFFLAYLVLWSFLVGAMLMSAVGVTSLAIYAPLADDVSNKVLYGILHSLLAVVLVRIGGYRLFQRVMGVCIGVMFVVVVATAVAMRPSIADLATGLVWPMIPDVPGGTTWTIALIGGVGGTVTILCYGYWIREEGRLSGEDLTVCRIDLATGYAMTALFGVAMVVIGSTLGPLKGGGASLVVEIARELEATLGRLGTVGKWAFLLGAWGAVFSSLLGVWQSVPYLFADFQSISRHHREKTPCDAIYTAGWSYQIYLYGIASIPIVGLAWIDFRTITKIYAVVGALFIPMLAAALLALNGQVRFVGAQHRNRVWTTLILVGTIVFFLFAGFLSIRAKFAG